MGVLYAIYVHMTTGEALPVGEPPTDWTVTVAEYAARTAEQWRRLNRDVK